MALARGSANGGWGELIRAGVRGVSLFVSAVGSCKASQQVRRE